MTITVTRDHKQTGVKFCLSYSCMILILLKPFYICVDEGYSRIYKMSKALIVVRNDLHGLSLCDASIFFICLIFHESDWLVNRTYMQSKTTCWILLSVHNIGSSMRQCVFGHLRTAKAQISLRIRTVWSGPSLSANRIIGYDRVYELRAKARMILCAGAGSSESAHFRMSEGTFSDCLGLLLQKLESGKRVIVIRVFGDCRFKPSSDHRL